MFDIPAEFQEKLKNAMKDESAIKLPFAAPTMWWYNGKPALKNIKEVTGATRFGGWGISKEELDDLSNDFIIPDHWQLHDDLVNGQGNTYAAYLTRTAWIAPIARRYAWFDVDGKGKSKVNILGYLATTSEGKLLPHGPVVLSASSLTGVELDKCLKAFASKTAQLRNGTPANFFYHPLGTWGKEPTFEERKGKAGASSSVTPPQIMIPETGITIETLQKWFVGPEIAKEMAEYHDQAQEWLDDWKSRKADKQALVPPEEPPHTEEDWPF